MSSMTQRRDDVDEPDALLGAGGRYVVGVDGSAASRAALAWAVLRTLPMRPLHLVGVVEQAGAPSTPGLDEVPPRFALMLSEAVRDLRAAFPDARVTTDLARGHVADALDRATGPADLLVVGSDKTGYVRGRTFGVKALQLAAALRGSLAVVPSVDLRLRTGVVVAIDDRGGAPALELRGAREAAMRSCTLTIVHAVPRDDGAQRAPSRDAALAAARDAALAAFPGLDVWTQSIARHAADAILNVSRDRSLLLLGRSHRTTALGVGETLHEVLLNANAPTVVLR